MQIRVGLIAAIYKKITNLSLANVSSTGFIVNLVSNDVQRFEDASPFLHYCWITPLQIIGYMTLIYYEIGWSMFAAVGCIGLIVPLQFCFGRFFKKYRKITVDFRDERIKCISDMIAGIQIVKLYAWEIPFIKKINEWRDAEMGYIWKGNFLKAINESIFFSSGVFVNALTFILYHYLGGQLTPAKIFSTSKPLPYSTILI
jgi:ATP-binding cassette subfamily C (CFTR/MRP) protein 4